MRRRIRGDVPSDGRWSSAASRCRHSGPSSCQEYAELLYVGMGEERDREAQYCQLLQLFSRLNSNAGTITARSVRDSALSGSAIRASRRLSALEEGKEST